VSRIFFFSAMAHTSSASVNLDKDTAYILYDMSGKAGYTHKTDTSWPLGKQSDFALYNFLYPSQKLEDNILPSRRDRSFFRFTRM
jgi:hypothetical protein